MLFSSLLRQDFERLPIQLRTVHDGRARKRLSGRCRVERGAHPLISILALVASLPPSHADTKTSVDITCDGDTETWTRNFDGHVMRSRLWKHDSLLAERLGAVTLRFRLTVEHSRIVWRVAGAGIFGIPVPKAWFAGCEATESVVDGRYEFDVRATLPIVGLLIHYRGWLMEHA